MQEEQHCFEFVNLSLNVRSKIHTWAEENALFHWTVKDDDKSILYLSNMLIHQETYARASRDKRRNSLASKCAEKVVQIQAEIDSLKSTPNASVSKLTALELRKQSQIPQSSSQEAVEKVCAVSNPPINQNKLPFQCDECEKSFAKSVGLSVHKRIHNKK